MRSEETKEIEETAPATEPDAPSIVQSETPVVVCGSLPECEDYERKKDKGYSFRRALYVGITTAWCIIMPVVFVLTGHETELAKQTAVALLGLASTICICYLGAGVIDRQRFLERLGDGMGNRRKGD